jgi:RNA polymerase sigma factor (sigma-70 family)
MTDVDRQSDPIIAYTLQEDLEGAYAYALRYAQALCSDQDDAEEIAQVAVVHFWLAGKGSSHTITSFRSYLKTTVRNEWINKLRRLRPRVSLDEMTDDGSVLQEPEDPVAIDQVIENRELLAIVQEYLSALPEDKRRIMQLHFFNDLDSEEIARQLHQPYNSVKSVVRRNRLKLRERFTAYRRS